MCKLQFFIFVLVFLNPYRALFLGGDYMNDAVNTISVNQFEDFNTGCEIFEIFKNTYLEEHLRMAVSGPVNLAKSKI